MKNRSRLLAALSTLLASGIWIYLYSSSVGLIDSTDGLLHFQHARYAWTHSELLLSHWAKPLFTTLAAIPALLGITGVVLMNGLLVASSGWAIMLIAEKNVWKAAPLAPLFLMLSESVVYTTFGALTEPLFIALVSWTFYAAQSNRWRFAMLLAGASLLSRPEAVVLIPVVAAVYLWSTRSLKHLPFLLIVPLAYSLWGWMAFDKSLFWIFTEQPYHPENDVYGSGDWLHYFDKWKEISDHLLLLLAPLGLAYHVKSLWRKSSKSVVPTGLMALGWGVLLLHILLWKMGTMGSAGLPRTIATALPGLILSAILAFEWVPQRVYGKLSSVVAVGWIVGFALHTHFPQPGNPAENTARELAMKMEAFEHPRLIAYQYAASAYYLNIDPWEEGRTVRLWSLKPHRPSERKILGPLTAGDWVIWDNITGHREGGLSLDACHADPRLVARDSAVSEFGAKLVWFEVQ